MFKKLEENFEKYLLIVSLIVMVILITMQVVCRLVGHGLVWAEELARYIMLYQIWLGAAYAVREDAHIRITSFVNRYKGVAKQKFSFIVLAVWLIFAIWLSVEGVILVTKIVAMGQLSPAMQIPMYIPYLSVPIGGSMMTIRLIQKMIQTLNGFEEPETEGEVA